MSRIATVNYGADAETQFQYATTDNDQFDRELDLYNLALAVERHDHGAGRGLPVARLAAGAVESAALAALSVQTAHLDNLSVTNGKLAAGAVTNDKITWPLVQSANSYAGGFLFQDSTNTYRFGFFMAGNGLASIGAGTLAAMGTNLVLGQSGQVSVGAAQGAALFNVLQQADLANGGIRLYNVAQTAYLDIWMDGSLNANLSGTGDLAISINDAGKVNIGATTGFNGRLTLTQQNQGAAEGFYLVYGGATGKIYLDNSLFLNIQNNTTSIILQTAVAALTPLTNLGASLGAVGYLWNEVRCDKLIVSTSATLPALAGLNIGGALTGATTGAFSSNVTIGGTLGVTAAKTTLHSLDVNNNLVMTNGGGRIYPPADNTVHIGDSGLAFSEIYVFGGFKPGGGSWSAISDVKAKLESSLRAYPLGLDAVLRMEPVYYSYSGEYGTPKDQEFVGFTAQHIQEIEPGMVGSMKAKRRPGSSQADEDVLTVNDSRLPYILVNAVKELKAEVDQLRAELRERQN